MGESASRLPSWPRSSRVCERLACPSRRRGWGRSEQTVDFDNSQVNEELFTYESAGSCKDGGWQQFTSSPGPFKNQGDCVSYFNNGK